MMALSVPDFGGLRVLVAGDAMLDEYWFGDSHRISPEAPVPVVQTRRTESRPGGAANVAVNLAALGARVTLAAIVGQDAQGKQLQSSLAAANVQTAFIVAEHLPTAHKLRVLARSQQLIRLDAEESFASLAADFAGHCQPLIAAVDVVVLSDYAKGTLASVAQLIAMCREVGKPVLVDPKGSDFGRYSGATVLTPNLVEFEAVAGHCPSEKDLLERGEVLRANLDLDALLVTRGSDGMTLFRATSAPVSFPAQSREVYDVTGAGDTVIGTLAAGLGAGADMADAVGLANLAAGIVIGRIGVAAVTASELRYALHRRRRGGRGVMTLDALLDVIRVARERGERLVFTNGCFDILHAGHVSYLEEARSLGDRLIVAVNSDASVARLKGPERPIVGLDDRMQVLAGLAAVDWVVAFDDDTPISVIEQVQPDVLVKGGDWAPEQIVGSEIVLGRGGEVRSLNFVAGRSTSGVIERVRAGVKD